MGSLRELPTVRAVVAALAFFLAAAAMVWPIHYRAANGLDLDGARNQFTLSGFSTQTCPWQIQLGHQPRAVPSAPLAKSNASVYLLDSYNDGQCAAKRYDRSSQTLLFLLIGFGLTVSNIRRRHV